MEAIRGKNDRRLLLGVTGGIATGKSTVVEMLKKKGAPVIDFDLLARKVVEPDQPAWRDIVTYFGEQVLQEDRTLNRKKLADIVFRDLEKRKKLESFIHPRIYEEFARELEELISKDPNAIIQVDIPLLIELNLQYMFHKVLVVYAPEEVQIKRLMERDGISREEAVNRLKAQLPIEEKVGYADFVIHNEGTLEETQKQVDELWEKLKEIQASRGT
jgi:dephospho-CoA kinase